MIRKLENNTRNTVDYLRGNNEYSFSEFYCFGNDYSKDTLDIKTGTNCCFTHFVGYPKKDNSNYPIFPYQIELLEHLERHRRIAVLKSRGIGISELMLRWILFKVMTEDYSNSEVIIVTGARIELAENLIKRMKQILGVYNVKDTKKTVLELNGCTIEAFPSFHSDAMRGLPNVKIILSDESDFFPRGQIENVQSVMDGYLPKSNPYSVLVSTPNLPNGLMENLFKDPDSLYRKIPLNYKIGLGLIYSEKEIELAKQSPHFEREFNLQFGYGIGDIFPNELLKGIVESYDLKLSDGEKILCVDPAFGSSKFAILGMEKINDIIYVKEALQFHRPSPSAMLDLVAQKSAEYGNHCLVDSAHSGLIRDLMDRGIHASAVNFRMELSNMTTESAQCVKEKKIRIHRAYSDLLAQLRAVRYNDRGHPDKTELSFDLGDCMLMGCNYFKSSNIRILSVPMGKTLNTISMMESDFVCVQCKGGNHSNVSHTMWIEDEDDGIKAFNCQCERC